MARPIRKADFEDPVLRALANAEPSNEWVHPDEDAMCEAALAELARGNGVASNVVTADIQARAK